MGKELKFYKIFLEKVWPKYRSDFYSAMYRTFHPSGYEESYVAPKENWEDAIEYIDAAIREGEKLGYLVIGNSKELYKPWKGTFGTSGSWHHWNWHIVVLYFDVLEDIVDEFRCYCGSNGIDPDCQGACMDEFPPTDYSYEGDVGRWSGGTLKKDYYTIHQYIMELVEDGAPIGELIGEDKLKLIELTSDDKNQPNSKYDPLDMSDTPMWRKTRGGVDINLAEEVGLPEPEKDKTQSIFQKTLKDMGVQFQFV